MNIEKSHPPTHFLLNSFIASWFLLVPYLFFWVSLCKYKIFGFCAQFQYVEGVFPHQQAIFQTPAECLRLQLNSDTIYPKTASNSTDKGAQSHKTVLYFRGQSQAQTDTCASDKLTTNCKFQWHPPTQFANCKPQLLPAPLTTPSLGSINLLKQLTELRKSLCFLEHWFTIKTYNAEKVRWKKYIGRDIRKGQSFHALSRQPALLEFPFVHQPRSSPNPVCLC